MAQSINIPPPPPGFDIDLSNVDQSVIPPPPAGFDVDVTDTAAPKIKSSRERYIEAMKDPSFRAKPHEERAKLLYPEEKKSPVYQKPGRGFFGSMQAQAAEGARSAGEGWYDITHGVPFDGNPTPPWAIPNALKPILNIVGGTAQQLLAPVTGPWNEYVSRPLGNLARKLPVPDPETLGQQVEIIGDVGLPSLIGPAFKAVKQPLAKALPTTQERISDLIWKKQTAQSPLIQKIVPEVDNLPASTIASPSSEFANTDAAKRLQALEFRRAEIERNIGIAGGRKINAIEQAALDAQKRTTAKQAGNFSQLPQERAAIEAKRAQEMADAQAEFATAQQRVGKQAAEAVGPLPPNRTNFDKRYGLLNLRASEFPAQPLALEGSASKISKEGGLANMPGRVEKASEGIANIIMDLPSGKTSMAHLYETRQRIRLEKRKAISSQGPNSRDARQLSDLEASITDDLSAAANQNPRAKAINALYDRVDRDYFQQQSLNLYKEGIERGINPTTGAWDRKLFTKWWDDYAGGETGDKYLRQMLGDRYDATKNLVADMQKANEINIEKAFKETIINLRRRYGEEMRGLNAKVGKESRLNKLSDKTDAQIIAGRKANIETAVRESELQNKAAVGQIEGAKDRLIADSKSAEKQIAELEKEYQAAVIEMVGFPYKGRLHKMLGSLQVIGGTAQTAGATLAGNVPAALGGLKSIGKGAFTLITDDMFAKIISTTHGSSIIRRAIRAAPGTGEAISASIALGNLSKQITSTDSSQLAQQNQRSSVAKDVLVEKYGLR